MQTSLTPNLMCDDVNTAVAFYRDTLGFQFLAGMPWEGPMISADPDSTALQWAMLMRDGAKLMFQARASLAQELPVFADQPLQASATFYLEMELAQWQALVAEVSGVVEVVLPERTTFYGMCELWLRDCNGYVVVIAAPVALA